MQQARVHAETARVAQARIGLVALPSVAILAIEERLREAGATVRRTSPVDTLWWRQTGNDAVVVHIGNNGVPGDLDRLTLLASHQRVIALFDDFPDAPVPDVLDFIVAPFRASEVLARLDRILVGPAPDEVLEAGNLRLDIATRMVTIDQRSVDVTYKEFELLRALLSVGEVVLSRGELKHHLGHDTTTGNRAMDLLVHRLRTKLVGWVGGRVETVRNVGYRVTRH